MWLQGLNETVQHSPDLVDTIQYALVVPLVHKPETSCDFQLNLHLALRPKGDIEVMEKHPLPLAALPLADIGWNGHRCTPDLGGESESLMDRKVRRYPVDLLDKHHRITPHLQIVK